MPHRDNGYGASGVIDLVDDSVGTSARGPQALEFEAQPLADPLRVCGDGFECLDDRCSRCLRQPVEPARSGSRHDETP